MGRHWISNASWNRCQCRLVKDKIDSSRRLTHDITIHDVADNKFNLRSNLGEILSATCDEVIQYTDLMALCQQCIYKVRSNKTGTACYEANSHRLPQDFKA